MNKPLMSEEPETMPAPTAPPAYDDEFKPPPYNPPPYNPQMQDVQIQQAGVHPSASAAAYQQQLFYAQPPPQQIYPQMMEPPTQPQAEVVVQNRRIFVGQLPVGTQPLTTVCPHCEAHIKTKTKSVTHCSAHLTCLLLCLIFCWCCSCLPYCIGSFHSVNHFCPNCKALLGVYHKP
ncbi:lipopolysaccharide-induced tumor necrosis factor-alpha factor homolog [Lycorma delicatula]|uniref:lipopolysaccharide-induced tumor necrosis factor-alpha factor homolog n=1 Tax=Lycorma delicatula TaxID=130591 RepID=UPI003F513387